MGARELEARDGEPPAHAARANDELVSLKPEPALGFDGVRIGEARGAGPFMDRYSQAVDVLAPQRVRITLTTSRTRASSCA